MEWLSSPLPFNLLVFNQASPLLFFTILFLIDYLGPPHLFCVHNLLFCVVVEFVLSVSLSGPAAELPTITRCAGRSFSLRCGG